jgi:LuxR family maltose regulon positive regulatory protein
MMAESRRALDYLPATNLTMRANAYWTMGCAHLWQGDRAAGRLALAESITLSQEAGDVFTKILATIALGDTQEVDNELHQAAATQQSVLALAGDQPLPIIHEAHLSLARVFYQWNDLDAAERHAHQALHLARLYDRVIDRFILCELFLVRLKLAQGDLAGAAAILAQTGQSVRQQHFAHRLPDVAAAQVALLLRQGQLEAAANLAQAHSIPISQARAYLAHGEPAAALALLAPLRQQAEARQWPDERLQAIVLQAVAYQALGQKWDARRHLAEALPLAEPGGFIRIFVDEGAPMARLLADAAAQGMAPGYVGRLLAALEAEPRRRPDRAPTASFDSALTEPLSQRELEVLQLIAHGLSNNEIGERLFLALDTVKGHNRRIFAKLQVQRRTEAVARARELGLL